MSILSVPSFKRSLVVIQLLIASLGFQPAIAQAIKPKAGGHQATKLASFEDWGAYMSQQGKNKICYALSEPKERLPKELKRDPAYMFVSFRPAENVKNEISVVFGFPTKEGGSAQASIGSSNIDFVTQTENAWVKNQSEESQVISTMSKGQSMTVKAASRRGNQTTDKYSLKGFADALKRAREECAS